jgi:hypothetical protein
MTNTLYIIGNGFDLYHGLNTRYQSFALFLKSKYQELYDLLLQYYCLPDLDEHDEASLRDPLWADFENALADLDFQSILHDKADYLANPANDDFRDRDWHAYQFEMEMIVEKLTLDLYNAFKAFILAVEFPCSVDNKLLELKRHSVFLNFNYTHTLEHFYFIKSKRILHIHGNAKIPGEILTLGHGREPSNFKKEEVVKEPEGLSEEEREMWRDEMFGSYDYSYESGRSELMSYFDASFKNTGEIIEEHKPFSEVDQPYFKKVIQSISDKEITWTVSFYSDHEHDSHLTKLVDIGLKKSQINLVRMETLKLSFPTLF